VIIRIHGRGKIGGGKRGRSGSVRETGLGIWGEIRVVLNREIIEICR
jgi:hypothetical protein